VIAVAAFGLSAPPAVALDDRPDSGNWVTDGPVYAVVHGAGRTFIGGNFTHVGPRTGVGAPIDGAGEASRPFPEVAGGQVYAAVSDGGGGWYIGGDFSSVGDAPIKNLAHISPAGSVDPAFDGQVGGTVRAIIVGGLDEEGTQPDEHVVYIGGDFTQVHGVSRSRAAALNSDGTLTTWSPTANDEVNALGEAYVTLNEASDPASAKSEQSIVFVGGAFTQIGSNASPVATNGLGAVWGVKSSQPAGSTADPIDRGFALSWSPSLAGSRPIVRAIQVGTPQVDTGNTFVNVPVYAGGEFTNGLVAKGIKVNLAPSGTPPVRTMGSSQPSYAWSAPATCPTGATNCAPVVRALALSGSTLYVGGDFKKLQDGERSYLGALGAIEHPAITSEQATLASWNPSADGSVRSLTVETHGNSLPSDVTVYAAGQFGAVGGASRAGLAAIAADGTPTGWDPKAAGGTAHVVTAGGGKVYAGGNFTSLGAAAVNRIAALDTSGALDNTWTASADDGPVQALAFSPDESTLYAGGGFTKVNNGTDRSHLAAFSTTDATLLPWAPNLNGWALAIKPAGSTVYVGGSFTGVGTDERRRIAAIDADGAVTRWNPGADDSVRAIDVVCGTVYLGGSFAHVDGQERGRIAAVGASSGHVTSWDPGDLGVVYAITHDAGSIFVGGSFALMGGAIRPGIAKLDAGTGKAAPWSPVAESPAIVRALQVSPSGNAIYAAGSFVRIGGEDRSRLASIDGVSGKATSWDPAANGPGYALFVSGDAVYVGGSFRQLSTRMQQGFGTYNAAVEAASAPASTGCAEQQTQVAATVPTTPTISSGTSTAPHRILPRLGVRHFRAKPSRFRVARPGAAATLKKHKFPLGSAFLFDLTRKANVTITIHRELFGRRKGKDCVGVGKSPHGRRCTRYQRYGTLQPRGVRQGHNSVAFSGMFGRKSLPPGIYTAKLEATVNQGKTRVAKLTRFQVVKS
jgi:hypothetical protein